jgi:hypothetical protein
MQVSLQLVHHRLNLQSHHVLVLAVFLPEVVALLQAEIAGAPSRGRF